MEHQTGSKTPCFNTVPKTMETVNNSIIGAAQSSMGQSNTVKTCPSGLMPQFNKHQWTGCKDGRGTKPEDKTFPCRPAKISEMFSSVKFPKLVKKSDAQDPDSDQEQNTDSAQLLVLLPNGERKYLKISQNIVGDESVIEAVPLNEDPPISACECGSCPNCKHLSAVENKENENHENKKIKLIRKKREEPEVLVLSSDDEDAKEPEEPNASEEQVDEFGGGLAEYIMENKQSNVFTTLQCRAIRIGSYKVKTKERVLVSSNELRMIVPSTEPDAPHVALQIEKSEILKAMMHFGEKVPVIFMYVIPKTASRIRKSLQMADKSGPYLDPTSDNETHKRITFLLEKITEDNKVALLSIFCDPNVGQELVESEAKDILVRACKTDDRNEITRILIFPPPPEKGGISLNNQDYGCLAEDQCLNDVIIDFYLKYLLTQLSKEDCKRTHVFSTFFFKRLTTKPKTFRDDDPENDVNLTVEEKRHSRVEKWTKQVNLFEKDFVIVPINEESHWYLAIICFPGLQGPVNFSDNSPVNDNANVPMKEPCILIFDSLLETDHLKTISILRDYLQVEHNKKIGTNRKFDEFTFKGCIPSVPQQNNFTDCGVFLLHYVEMFFKDPIKDYRSPIDLDNWFHIGIIYMKRKAIADLIIKLMTDQGVDIYEIGLPILFYSSDEDEDDDGNLEEGEISRKRQIVDYDDTSDSDGDEECEEEEEEEEEDDEGVNEQDVSLENRIADCTNGSLKDLIKGTRLIQNSPVLNSDLIKTFQLAVKKPKLDLQ